MLIEAALVQIGQQREDRAIVGRQQSAHRGKVVRVGIPDAEHGEAGAALNAPWATVTTETPASTRRRASNKSGQP